MKSLGNIDRESWMVYGLTDPRSGFIRYVGRSTSGHVRPRAHLSPRAEGPKKRRWVSELKKEKLIFGIVTLEVCDTFTALVRAERRWTKYGWDNGWPLLNERGAKIGGVPRWIRMRRSEKRRKELIEWAKELDAR